MTNGEPVGSMTSGLHPASVVGVGTTSPSASGRPRALVDLASDWLNAEAASVSETARIALVAIAGERASKYEGALVAAPADDLRLAWELAIARQAQHDIGSAPWVASSRVSELLRFEYLAAQEDCTLTTTRE